MPHRPQSASPKPPEQNCTPVPESVLAYITEPHAHEYDWKDSGSDPEGTDSSLNHSYESSSDSGLEDDEDADAPRIAQWDDGQELEEPAEDSQGSSRIHALQVDLLGLPLGALRKAQSILTPTIGDFHDVEISNGTKPSVEPEESQHERDSATKRKARPEWSLKPRFDIAKRTNKNAPVEITSKRPVTRKRTVVEVKQVQARDPRFLPLAGEFSGEKFQQHYGFLAESHESELKTLQTNLKHARKLLASSPLGLLVERQQEVKRLELAVKRAESFVNNDRQCKVEREVLVKITREEKDKRKHGKAGWWLKESEKRELLVRARYDALVAEGGKQAVKKAIGRKEKKLSQKEKKSRPFLKEDQQQLHRKRSSNAISQEGGSVEKRRRVE